VTRTADEEVPAFGALAVIDVSVVGAVNVAVTPPMATAVVPVRLRPEIVTVAAEANVAGLRPVTIGAGQSWTRWEAPWARFVAICWKMPARADPDGELK
jgi:hypothetical protein